MTTAEKLVLVAENMQKVYDAGYSAGNANAEHVSLLDINANGGLTATTGGIRDLTKNSFEMVNGTTGVGSVDITLNGYYVFWLHINTSYYKMWVDGELYSTNENDPSVIEQIVAFNGKIFKKITIMGDNASVLFDNFIKGSTMLVDAYDSGHTDGMEAGKEAERSAFWDDFQEFGNRTAYNNAFQNAWSDALFRPKYDIRPTSAGYMFAGSKIANLKGCLELNGVVLDTSNATSVDYMFSGATRLSYCPAISTIKDSSLTTVFYDCKSLISIDKLILKSDGSQTFSNECFKNCTSLQEIRFEGTIGNSINLQWCTKLSAESYNSLIECLAGSATGDTLGTITLPSNVESVFDARYGSGSWAMMVGARPYWDFVTV